MQTHDDSSHRLAEFAEKLNRRAEDMEQSLASVITAGAPGESPLQEWKYGGCMVNKLPDDPQGILRISVGGGIDMIDIGYCVFRGDRERCLSLLRTAISALEQGS